MADLSDDESDPEMAEDLEENVPELEEILEEIFDNGDREMPICHVHSDKVCAVCEHNLPK